MTTDAQLAPTDDEIHAVVQACRERGLREFDVFRAVLAKWGTQPQPGAVYAELPEPDFGPGRYLGKATGDAYTKEQLRDFADRTHAARLRCKSEQARLATLWGYVRADAAPKAAPGVGNSGFDHKSAADFLSGKTISDEAVRKFVAASRWAHDERAALSATLLAMHGALTSREAEIALLKKALLEAEAAPQQEAQELVLEGYTLPPLPEPDLRDVGTKPQDIKDYLRGYATEYAKLALRLSQPAAQQGVAYAELPDEGEPWHGHKFKEVQRGCWRCDCGKTIKEVTSDQSTPASGGNYPVMPKRYTVDDDGEELFTAEKMRAFADATHTLRASHGQAPASVLHLVHSAFAEIAMAFPKAFALHKVGIADTAVREALAAPARKQGASHDR